MTTAPDAPIAHHPSGETITNPPAAVPTSRPRRSRTEPNIGVSPISLVCGLGAAHRDFSPSVARIFLTTLSYQLSRYGAVRGY
jgi:hypothetical protein